MKKFIFTLLALMAILPALAGSHFTMGVNDTVRIRPIFLGLQHNLDVRALFEGRLDHWNLNISYPVGLEYSLANPSDGMSVPFLSYDGIDSIYNAPLSVANAGAVISSTITKFGYWDSNNDGILESYGTIKWEADEYDPMFELRLEVRSYFRSGYLTINGLLSCTPDWRPGYNEYNCVFNRSIFIYVGLMRGDINGDEVINIADVTMLIDYMVGQVVLDEFQLDAADVNGDGMIGIADVTALNDLL